MLSFVERCQSVLAGVILALLIASVVLVPQNRALADGGGDPIINRRTPSGNPHAPPGSVGWCDCTGDCLQGTLTWQCTPKVITVDLGNGMFEKKCACKCGTPVP